MDICGDLLVTDVGFHVILLSEGCWCIEPLERWVLETILWVSYLGSSPWFWENTLVC